MAKFRIYNDEQCLQMIRSGIYPQDAPKFVILEIRKNRKKFDRKIKSPEKEMAEFMKGINAQRSDNTDKRGNYGY